MAKKRDSNNHNKVIEKCSGCGNSSLTIYLEDGYCQKCLDG